MKNDLSDFVVIKAQATEQKCDPANSGWCLLVDNPQFFHQVRGAQLGAHTIF